MKKTLVVIATLALAAGCGGKKSQPQQTGSVTDLQNPPAYSSSPAPSATPAYTTEQPMHESTAAPAAGKNYVVKKGDTLWSIAQRTYGDGKQYTKIVAANPGLSPTSLKAGQTIVLP